MERKFTYRQYHIQDNADYSQKHVRMYCNTNKFPELPFCGPHSKTHGERGLSMYYHLSFGPKLGNGVCAVLHIPCACVTCKSMLDKPLTYGIQSDKQEQYKPVTKCIYWPFLGPFNNWNINQFSYNSTPYNSFDEMHQVVLDGISDNVASLAESVKYVEINTPDTKTNGVYVIMFASEAYTLQDNTTIDRQIITARKLVVKA